MRSRDACACNGTGFVPFRGDFRMTDGSVKKHVAQVLRCPAYVDYFRESPLMRDYPGRVPVRRGHGICGGAIKAHELIWRTTEAKRKDSKEL